MKTGRVSVALCSYQGEKFIAEQLDSILAQTVAVDEIVVADDGSTDGTLDILSTYAGRYPDTVRPLRGGENVGTLGNVERALRATQGEVVFLADQDDLWVPDKVAVLGARLAAAPHAELVFSNGSLIDEGGRPLPGTLWDRWNFPMPVRDAWRASPRRALVDLVNNRHAVTGATVALRRTLLQRALPIRVPAEYWHDAWLALHAAARGALLLEERCLVRYRVHAAQQVGLGTAPASSARRDRVSESDFRQALSAQYPQHAHALTDMRYWYRASRWARAADAAWRRLVRAAGQAPN